MQEESAEIKKKSYPYKMDGEVYGMKEQTLVIVKPDGVERGLVGEIIRRIEQRGMKIIALKMSLVDKEFAKKHHNREGSKSGTKIPTKTFKQKARGRK